MRKLRAIDLFSGIGGFRNGFEKSGAFEFVGWCEYDANAQKSYRGMYDTEGEWFNNDIRTVESADIARLRADAICFGFPCTDISVAGKMQGFFQKKEGKDSPQEPGEQQEEEQEFELTRSGLFFEVVRILKGMQQEDRPKWLFIENVKNLLSIDAGIGVKGSGFLRIIVELDALGYDAEWQVFNTKNTYVVPNERTREYVLVDGIPQNRERVYICARKRTTRRAGCRAKVFPICRADEENLIELNQIGRLSNGSWGNPSVGRVYDREGLAPTLNCCGGVDTNLTLQQGGIPSEDGSVNHKIGGVNE